jgi:penicillin amidase
MIVDLADMDASRFIIAPGQSGNVLSPHYRDLLETWRDHGYVRLDGEPVGGTLVLSPP